MTSPASAKLRQLAATEGIRGPGADNVERCESCRSPVSPGHRHMVDVEESRLVCACKACCDPFDRSEGRGGRYRLVPERVREIADFQLDDTAWESLRLPVDMAFFFYQSPAQRVVALHPSRMGVTESPLQASAWEALVGVNPILRSLEPDVEALLVDRTTQPRRHWLVPADVCYRLVALIQTHWKGFGGGPQVWEEIAGFLAGLQSRARPVSRLSIPGPANAEAQTA